MKQISVTKRSGRKEALDIEKLHKVVENACEGLSGVSASEVEIQAQLSFDDGIKTPDIQAALIQAAAGLISEDTPNYQYVAGRLVNYQLRKEVYNQYEPLPLYDIVKKNIKLRLYTEELLEWYTKEEFDFLDTLVDHTRDEEIVYCGMEQYRGKYLVKNRVTGQIVETPQVALILIAAVLFRNYENRFKWIKEAYDVVSKHYISLATPLMAGIRTKLKQFSSCVLIDTDDDLDSIGASGHAVLKYVAQRAGLGINVGRFRGLGASIRDGLAYHTGITSFYRFLQGAVRSCNQGGIRSGSATFNVQFWHNEIENILVMKNNKGTEDNRVRHVDYCIQFNKVMYERILSNGVITLFNPNEVPGLYDAYFRDVEEFRILYEAAEQNPKINKKQVSAVELYSTFLQERKDTGRIYCMNVDNANEQSPFINSLIYMTNLCTEIMLPSKPFYNITDENGRIPLCTLCSVNMGTTKKTDLPKVCELAVRILNEVLDYQEFPVKAAEEFNKDWRALGVGITNMAYWLAKNGYTYQTPTVESLDAFDDWCETWSFNLIKASANMAVEQNRTCRMINDSKYGLGIVPMDYRKPFIDTVTPHVERQDWTSLKQQLRTTGILNGTLMATAPTETSSQPQNATNGFNPPRALVSIKVSKDGVLPQVVPEIIKLKNKYDLAWDQKSPRGFLTYAGILQKWTDQTLSCDMNYNPEFFPDGEIPMSVLVEDHIYSYKLGLKSNYYLNVKDGAKEVEIPADLEDLEDEAECSSCVL
jgi:ribonucleoside-diphosphate reductase alpha chain